MRSWYVAWIAGLGLAAVAQAEETIKIGVVLPYSGVYASLGWRHHRRHAVSI